MRVIGRGGTLVPVGVAVGVAVAAITDVAVGVCAGVQVGVFVGVTVGVLVAGWVGVFVGVAVGVLVADWVGVFVGVTVGVFVGVGVGRVFRPSGDRLIREDLNGSLPSGRQTVNGSQIGHLCLSCPQGISDCEK